MWQFLDVQALRNHELQWLWIDQICIDQSATYEHNHQVGLMGQIFGWAHQVLVWLGAEADGSDEAMIAIDEGLVNGHLGEIETLLRRPYWHRLWILQEVLMAGKVLVLCGNKMFPWQYLQDFHMPGPYDDDIIPDLLNIEPVPASLIKERALFSSHERLGHILATFAGLHCQDPRDKVFGLLSLIRPSGRITVDYSMTAAEVFFAAVRKMLEDESYLGIDSHLNVALSLRRNMGLEGSSIFQTPQACSRKYQGASSSTGMNPCTCRV